MSRFKEITWSSINTDYLLRYFHDFHYVVVIDDTGT